MTSTLISGIDELSFQKKFLDVSMKSDKLKPWALLAPSLTAVFLLLVIPVCFVVVYSFWLRAPSGSDIPAFQFGNYAKFFEDFFYPSLLIRTLRVALETVLLCLVMGYIPAYFFYRTESKLKPFLMILIMLPFWISFIIRTLSWINILGDTGLINHALTRIGLIDAPLPMLYNEGAVLMGLIQFLRTAKAFALSFLIHGSYRKASLTLLRTR